MNYYIRNQAGDNEGPYDETQLRGMLETGSLKKEDCVFPEGGSDGIPVAQILDAPSSPGNLPPSPMPGTPGPRIENYLLRSVVALALFWPTGLPALINATRVDTLVYQGQIELARQTSEKAKKYSNITFIVSGIFWGLFILAFVVLFAMHSAQMLPES